VPFPQAAYLEHALAAAQAVDAGVIAQQFVAQPQKIAEAIHAARVIAVDQAIGAIRPV